MTTRVLRYLFAALAAVMIVAPPPQYFAACAAKAPHHPSSQSPQQQRTPLASLTHTTWAAAARFWRGVSELKQRTADRSCSSSNVGHSSGSASLQRALRPLRC